MTTKEGTSSTFLPVQLAPSTGPGPHPPRCAQKPQHLRDFEVPGQLEARTSWGHARCSVAIRDRVRLLATERGGYMHARRQPAAKRARVTRHDFLGSERRPGRGRWSFGTL